MIPRLAPNQKAIRIVKSVCDKEHTYSLLNRVAAEKALRELRPNSFKLWCYLNLNTIISNSMRLESMVILKKKRGI